MYPYRKVLPKHVILHPINTTTQRKKAVNYPFNGLHLLHALIIVLNPIWM